jgi:ABC-type phosphate transport system permease subunit
MPTEKESVPFERRFRHALRTHRAALSVLVLAIGTLLTVLALGYFTPLSSSFPFSAINSETNPSAGPNYNLLFVIVGPIIVIVGAYLVGAYFSARQKFEHLMLTKSKAEFLRNIPEIEKLLWDLTPRDEVRYDQKRAELRLPR